MKKLFTSLIIFLTLLLVVSCSNGSTDPNNNNNNNNNSQSFTGDFTFGAFGQASALTINEDGSIYMNVENGLLTIKKEMVTKISDSKYHIKGEMPVINYDTSAASLKSSMSFQNAANMNTIDVMLNIGGGNLSLSGKVNSDSVTATLQEVSGYMPSNYAGIYYTYYGEECYGYEVKSDGIVVNIGLQNDNVIYYKGYTEKLIKVSENEYILNVDSLEKDAIPPTGTITPEQAYIIILEEAQKYNNMSVKSTFKFENNTLTVTGGSLIVSCKDPTAMDEYTKKVAEDRAYTNQIDYTLFTLKPEESSPTIFNKK